MSVSAVPRKLWQHPDPAATNIGRFSQALGKRCGKQFQNYDELFQFSVNRRTEFWGFLLEYANFIQQGRYDRVVDEAARMDSLPLWFEGLEVNYTENVLYSRNGTVEGKEDDKIAITEASESGLQTTKRWTWGQLRQRTGHLLQAMKAHGVGRGDRIAAVSCNNLNTLLIFLATTALGGIFSSSSTDMGVKGILDRLVQVKPKFVFMDDTALYNLKHVDLREKMRSVIDGMASIPEFQGVVAVPHNQVPAKDISGLPKTQLFEDFLSKPKSDTLEFTRVPFGSPFLIVYSSGTTGTPKCIAHSVGAALLNGFKEGHLHHELSSKSVALQYTTTSWIMYLAQVQNLLAGAKVVLYDGSPFLPDAKILLNLSEQEGVTHLGISPRYLQELQRARIQPKTAVDLSRLEIVSSTGMVLPESLFEWFYDEGFPSKVRLNNMSGGTDIMGCFAIGNAMTPVYVGGSPERGLGIKVEVYDSTIEGSYVKGQAVEDGAPGELVATAGFPNQPVTFWGQDGPDRYQKAYFARFDNVWTHGDFIMLHPATKQVFFLGRSDGVLNPSGVRFGSAEIYRIIESEFAAEVVDSVCVGRRRPNDNDEKVFLFLLMRPNVKFSEALASRIRKAVSEGLSKRHVPAFIFPTPEIPTTVNMKKVELPVKQIISGATIKPSGMLANPKSLDYYYQFAKVEKGQPAKSKL